MNSDLPVHMEVQKSYIFTLKVSVPVHSILKGSPWRTNDHPSPVLQVDVVLVLQAPAANKKQCVVKTEINVEKFAAKYVSS